MKFKRFTINKGKLNKVQDILNNSHGNRFTPNNKGVPDMCVMEAVSWVTDSAFKTDHPECSDPFLTGHCISMNDAFGDGWYFMDGEQRINGDYMRSTYLRPLIPDLINTKLVVYGTTGKSQGYGPDQEIEFPRSAETLKLADRLADTYVEFQQNVALARDRKDAKALHALAKERVDMLREYANLLRADIKAYKIEKGWSKPSKKSDVVADNNLTCDITYVPADAELSGVS